jgi:TPR repeat protein
MKRMQIAAEAGDALAQFNLGVMYDQGMDDNYHPRVADHENAILWLLRAAKQGLPRAQLRLAQAYVSADDLVDHRVEAGAWFLRAAEGSHDAQQFEAQKGFKKVASEMSDDEIESSRALAETWRAGETWVPEVANRRRRF